MVNAKNVMFFNVFFVFCLLLPEVAYAQEDSSGGGTFGDYLGYKLDSFFDDVKLFFTFDEVSDVRLKLQIAEKKLDKISEFSEKGNAGLADIARSDYEKVVDEIEIAVAANEQLKSELVNETLKSINSSLTVEELNTTALNVSLIADLVNLTSVNESAVVPELPSESSRSRSANKTYDSTEPKEANRPSDVPVVASLSQQDAVISSPRSDGHGGYAEPSGGMSGPLSDEEIARELELVNTSKCLNSTFTVVLEEYRPVPVNTATPEKAIMATVHYVSGVKEIPLYQAYLVSSACYSASGLNYQENVTIKPGDFKQFDIFWDFECPIEHFQFSGECDQQQTLVSVFCNLTQGYGVVETCLNSVFGRETMICAGLCRGQV